MLFERLTPRLSIWRSRILLKPIIEVSEAEKKKERRAKIKNSITVLCSENSGCII